MDFELFSTFFKIGMFTIGGGYAMLPNIQHEIVDKKAWLKEKELVDLIAVAQSCPGILAINISIFVGHKVSGTRGAFFCALGTALPSFLIILGIAMFFQKFRDIDVINRFFLGIRPAVVALIASPIFKMARTAKLNRYNAWIPIVAALAIWQLNFNPVYIILLAAIGGFLYGKIQEDINNESA